MINRIDEIRQPEKFQEQALPTLLENKKLQYIDFPNDLKGKYQSFTQANLDQLRSVGYTQSFNTVEEGVRKYMRWLSDNSDFLAEKL